MFCVASVGIYILGLGLDLDMDLDYHEEEALALGGKVRVSTLWMSTC